MKWTLLLAQTKINLFLLLQGYRPQACFRLQQNAYDSKLFFLITYLALFMLGHETQGKNFYDIRFVGLLTNVTVI
jgi:hypothetical protein